MNLRRAFFYQLWKLTGFDKERRIVLPWLLPDGPVYYIVRRTLSWGGTGFFSNYFYALSHIAYAKEKGWVPVVDMRNYRTLYSENHPIRGTLNAWEYYFLQPVSTYTAYRSGRFILSESLALRNEWKVFHETDDAVELDMDRACLLKTLCAEYIALHPVLKNEIDQWRTEYLSHKKVLGVHWRGTDKRAPPAGHRRTPPLQTLLDAVQNMIQHHSDINIVFLASDESGIREALQETVSVPVVTSEAYRLEAGDGRGLHTAFVHHARPDHHYLLGAEVLRDAYLLSYCDYLVQGHSNVTNAALFLRDKPYADRVVVASSF